MPCDPAVIVIDGDFVFPVHAHGTPFTPVDIPIEGCGLQNLHPGPAHVTVGIRTWGIPDENFNWSYTGWWIAQDFELRYESRDDTHLLGVTKYPSKGKINDGVHISTSYYNPDAYWVPAAPGDPPPPGGDPDALPGDDPTTLDPPVHTVYANRPYHYADMLIYDFMGKNLTGGDLAQDPDNPGEFFDPYDPDDNVVSFIYNKDETGVFSEDTNLQGAVWTPDAESTRNQQVALLSAAREGARGIRKIARNIESWREIGVYSSWDSIGGSNVQDVSEDNVAGYAATEVERFGRPPNFLKLTLPIEPADGWPEFGEIGYRPMPFRDFQHGDRVLARYRHGYADTGLIAVRIMSMKIGRADANNNVKVELEVVPHMTDLSEISVV